VSVHVYGLARSEADDQFAIEEEGFYISPAMAL
jgi:hypothetical protein